MTRSLKKGPYVDEKLENKLISMGDSKKKESTKNMVSTINNNSKLCWSYYSGP